MAILATDMARHVEVVAALAARARGRGPFAPPFSTDGADVDALVGALVHAADFAGCVRAPTDVGPVTLTWFATTTPGASSTPGPT